MWENDRDTISNDDFEEALDLLKEQRQVIDNLATKVKNYRKNLSSLQKAYEYTQFQYFAKIDRCKQLADAFQSLTKENTNLREKIVKPTPPPTEERREDSTKRTPCKDE